MRPIGLAALALLAGCASRPPLEEPTIKTVPPTLIAAEGASLYILDAPDDWADDGLTVQVAAKEADDPPIGPKPSSNAQWLGEHSLKLALRRALSQKSISFIGHADFQPLAGWPIEATHFNPDANRAAAGESVGFRVRLKASPTDHPGYMAIDWEAEKLTDRPESKGGRAVESISRGSCRLPYRATLMMHHRKDKNRFYVLLLRVTSLKE